MTSNAPESSLSEEHLKCADSVDKVPNKVDGRKPLYLEHTSNWLDSVKAYVKETEAKYLNLESRGLGVSEIKSIMKFLPAMHVTKLSLESNNLRGRMRKLSKLLSKTKLKKLNLRSCDLSKKDILCVMKVLKDTEISNLDISGNPTQLTEKEAHKFLSLLLKSHLTTIKLPTSFFDAEFTPLLFETLPNTSLTCLDLSNANLKAFSCMESLFLNLYLTSIEELSLRNLKLNHDLLMMLFENMKVSKIEKLDLSQNGINDALMNFLAESLVDSNITDLDLSTNKFSGANDFGRSLKSTKIRTLNISGNSIVESRMFCFPDFLKGTSVVKLNISHCSLTSEIWEELMKSLEFSKLSKLVVGENEYSLEHFYTFVENLSRATIDNVVFSCNSLPPAGHVTLNKYFKASKLRHVDVSPNSPPEELDFFAGSKNSPITTLKIVGSCYSPSHLIMGLMNPTFTCLDLCSIQLGHYVANLATYLKFTAVTRLLLSGNDINDTGAVAIAKCLKDTIIVELDLSVNSIKNPGAKALACALKDSQLRQLRLNENRIGIAGLKVLAEKIENTCVTVLDVFSNPGNWVILVDKVLWRNRMLTHKLVRWFVQIAPETYDSYLRFNCVCDNLDVSSFLEDCLVCYKMIIEQPNAINLLKEEENIPFSKAEIFSLMSEKFPEQFSSFIGTCLEADIAQHIGFLKRAEELQLSKLVELLLLNRPIYTIEENQNILHPYVYQLLHKYNQPVCNLVIEPQGKMKIVDYFREHSDLDGAKNVVEILLNETAS